MVSPYSIFKYIKHHSKAMIAMIIVIVLFVPIIFSGLYSDDLMNFQLLQSIPDFTFQKMVSYADAEIDYMMLSGRYTPVSFYLLGFMFWLPKSILQYKLLVFLGNVIAVLSFVYFLRKARMAEYTAVALLLYACFIQFQVGYHDCFTSLNAMYPIAISFSLISVAFFLDVIKNGSLVKWIMAFVFALITQLITEVGIVTFLIIIGLSIFNNLNLKKRLLFAFPFILFPLFYFGYLAYFRAHHEVYYVGVKTSFNFLGMLKVLSCQLFSTLPLSNFYKLYAIPKLFFIQLLNPWILVGAIVLFILILLWFFKFKESTIPTEKGRVTNLFIGILYLFIPPMILMFSSKYQTELKFGYAYLPLYFQNFGLVIIITFIYSFLKNRFHGKIVAKVVLCSIFSLVIISTFLLNCCMINARNQDQSIPANYYYQSIKEGILVPVMDHSVLVLGTDFFYKQPLKYSQIMTNFSGKNLEVIEQSDFDISKISSEKAVFKLQYDKEKGLSQLFKWNKETEAFYKINEMAFPPSKTLTDAELRTIRKMFF